MIATLVSYCSNCDTFSKYQVHPCDKCGGPLETKAAINTYELQQLIKQLTTPEGLAKALIAIQKWFKG